MSNIYIRSVLLTAILGLSACAMIQPNTEEDLVFSLAGQRQAALLKQDFKKAYQYMSPGYRQLNTVEQLSASYAGVYSWVSSNVKNVSCSDDVCKVGVEVEVDIGLMMNSSRRPEADRFIVKRFNSETWFKLDGKWWFSKLE